MNDSVIREATESDLPAILELYAQPSFNGDAVSLERAQQIYQVIKTYPNYQIFVAEDAGVIVGTLCLIVFCNISAMGKSSAIIESVVIRADFQGKGVGKQLVEHAMNAASKQGAYKIALYSGSPNDYVHHFYEGLGFERHGISYRLEIKEYAA